MPQVIKKPHCVIKIASKGPALEKLAPESEGMERLKQNTAANEWRLKEQDDIRPCFVEHSCAFLLRKTGP